MILAASRTADDERALSKAQRIGEFDFVTGERRTNWSYRS